MDKTNLEDFFSNGSIQMYSFGLVAKIVFAENPHNTNLVVHTAKEKKKKIQHSETTHMSSILCKKRLNMLDLSEELIKYWKNSTLAFFAPLSAMLFFRIAR